MVKRNARSSFGPVSTINTAPVAIGNSIRGSKATTRTTPDGARIVGRDFAFSLNGTSSTVTEWELIGGMPITPCVLPSSILRNYCQMFSKFKINKLVIHYITSSPTSQAGDVMFYFERDRKSAAPDYSNASFLPFVLSDPLTVIGPQWTNHSLVVNSSRDWKTTAYGLNADLNEDAAGTVYFFSKTNSVSSPGYVLMDYDISFSGMAVNPRAGQLPVSRGQFSQVALGVTTGDAVSTVAGTTNVTLRPVGNGVGGTAALMPNGAVSGDVYKIVVAARASPIVNTWSAAVGTPTLANIVVAAAAVDLPYTVDDGCTLYGAWSDGVTGGGDAPSMTIYPTLETAMIRTGGLRYGVTTTNINFSLCCNLSLVGSNSFVFNQSSY